MKTSFISTLSLSDSSRRHIQDQSFMVKKLGVELSSGRKYDVGLDLGTRTGEAVTLRAEFHFLSGITDTNALTAARMDVSQAAMQDVLDDAQGFLATLVGLKENNFGADIVMSEASGKMEMLTSRMNTQLNGSFLFAGINSDQEPFADYRDPASPNKVAADAAFLAEFGFTQNDPNVSTITPAAMDAYLTGDFDAMFADPAWGATWSTASDTQVTSRISASETVTSSVGANEQAFRDLAKVYTMMGDLGVDSLSKETYEVVVNKAIETVGAAINGLTSAMGKMGNVQEQVKLASSRLTVQTDILNERINNLENVNLEETSVRLNTALTQLETTYAVTARMQGLSLLNYI
ncbi:flagellar hook-associated family protein [Roseibium denhamense]|uniref:Flagellin n=1 Tax=Roseibium denhamense TaxID=76305 RepID=A0ABY1PEZ8_9HYPH|nr:flagellar hook-associated family protein [Roseibium denhamense]MTI06239.1 flagellar hook-associated family protein [Roseibium denhamense]SMP32741.1 flagellar hook-associated protein 3 FlgL [Roseibium denhamense]